MRVYIAAPLAMRSQVLELNDALSRSGLQTAATWPLTSPDTELNRPQAIALCNMIDADLDDTEAMIVLAHDANGETFAQFGQAVARGIPVVWVDGAPILSTNRVGVVHAATFEDAIVVLRSWAPLVDIRPRTPQTPNLHAQVEWARRVIMSLLLEATANLELEATEGAAAE